MTLISCEIGFEPRRNATCQLKRRLSRWVEFWHIPTNILELVIPSERYAIKMRSAGNFHI
jgi:hypothetical protein